MLAATGQAAHYSTLSLAPFIQCRIMAHHTQRPIRRTKRQSTGIAGIHCFICLFRQRFCFECHSCTWLLGYLSPCVHVRLQYWSLLPKIDERRAERAAMSLTTDELKKATRQKVQNASNTFRKMHGRMSNTDIFRTMTKFEDTRASEIQHLDVVSRFRLRRVSNMNNPDLMKKNPTYVPTTIFKPSSTLYRIWQLVRWFAQPEGRS